MRTQVFAYKGTIGIQSDVKAEGLLNHPLDKWQLGFVVDASSVDISPEALALLKKVRKSGDDIGDVDVYKTDGGKVIFSWMGGPLKKFKPEQVTGSSLYDASLLKSCDGVVIDEKFKAIVDGN